MAATDYLIYEEKCVIRKRDLVTHCEVKVTQAITERPGEEELFPLH